MIVDTDDYMEPGKYYMDNYVIMHPENKVIKQPIYCIRSATLEEYREYAKSIGGTLTHEIKKYIYLVHTD